MDVTSIATLATNMEQERFGQAVGISVLKKALDVERSNAALLLQAVEQSGPARTVKLPPHLGQNINTLA